MELLSYLCDDRLEDTSQFHEDAVVTEVGTKLNFITPWCSNTIAILNKCGTYNIQRIERSYRYLPEYVAHKFDEMVETIYHEPLESFGKTTPRESVQHISLDSLAEFSEQHGLGFDETDLNYYRELFETAGRAPTDVELYDLAQSNSEHSRHWLFNGTLTVQREDGTLEPVSETLFKTVKSTLPKHGTNSVVAFCDNASAIMKGGFLGPLRSDSGPYSNSHKLPTFTAETHNFPTGVAPFPGAATGVGGRIRDTLAIGRGAEMIAGTAGYCVGSDERARNILIEASNGASDYGNKIGEPIIQGFCRSFGLNVGPHERVEWVKPIMFSGGLGEVQKDAAFKREPQVGYHVVRLGGPAYRIGLNGGSASSRGQDNKNAEQDLSAVQRGDPQMENRVMRVVRAGTHLIESIHDQGAGGMANVTKEIVASSSSVKTGAIIDLGAVVSGDPSLSARELWVAEYQEQMTMLVKPENLEELLEIATRENVPLVSVGQIDSSGQIKVLDTDGSQVVDLDLDLVLGEIPQKGYTLIANTPVNLPLELPVEPDFESLLMQVLSEPGVGSKRFLVNKVDRSVTGRIAQQQCVGPYQTPLANVAVVSDSIVDTKPTGTVTAIGERPIISLVSAEAMARMSVAEMLTNIVWAKISKLEDIKCSGNWMWPAKTAEKKYHLYQAVNAVSDVMKKIGISIDGGKDSLSMSAKVNGETVDAPETLVVSGYVTTGNHHIGMKVTPDFKKPGNAIVFIGSSQTRLGGSVLATSVLKQVGDSCPDLDNMEVDTLTRTFKLIQSLHRKEFDSLISIYAGHDRSDGGLITTLVEMAIAGGHGFQIFPDMANGALETMFNEEWGVVLELNSKFAEYLINSEDEDCPSVKWGVRPVMLGFVTEQRRCIVDGIMNIPLNDLWQAWERPSFDLERDQTAISCVEQEFEGLFKQNKFLHVAPVDWEWESVERPTCSDQRPRIGIVREEGSNGDQEMSAAFWLAGFDIVDLPMNDLLASPSDEPNPLMKLAGLVFVGGFSYSDVFGAAKGWAAVIKSNPKLQRWFQEFYESETKFSLGVCNGCQLMAELGWLGDVQMKENLSGRFESRFSNVIIEPDHRTMMLKGLEHCRLGVWIAHGEGRFDGNLTNCPIRYVDDGGRFTETYPYNPAGSPDGVAALSSPNGLHLAMMPHPERSIKLWQWPWYNPNDKLIQGHEDSPWIQMFRNAYKFALGL